MGELSDAIKAYKTSPDNSPAEREAIDVINRITQGEWWRDNVGTEFKWPKKYNKKSLLFGFGPEFIRVGNFIIPQSQFKEQISLLTKYQESIR